MTLGDDRWPLRADVEMAWRQVIAGERTRENVHDWSAPWVEGKTPDRPPHDLMVGTGLQYLDGLDMTASPASPNLISHGGSGNYVLSEDEVVARLEHWLAKCADYDADPAGFLQRIREQRGR